MTTTTTSSITTSAHGWSANSSNPEVSGWHEVRAVGLAALICVGVLLFCALALTAGIQVSIWQTPRPDPPFHPRLAALPAGPMLPLPEATRGHEVFVQACSACHGIDGFGKQGLGMSLVHSDYIADRSNSALVAFIIKGREATALANTTKVAMPPKGGNPSLTESDLAAVVVYMRGLQDPRRMPELPPIIFKMAPVTNEEKSQALAAAGGDAELAEIIASGTKLFNSVCIACHGPGGIGVKGNGQMLANNDFIKSLKDDDLLAFLKQGRAPSDPKNITGIQMPPKGGNPALSDDDLLDIIEYLRTLQPKQPKQPNSTSEKLHAPATLAPTEVLPVTAQ